MHSYSDAQKLIATARDPRGRGKKIGNNTYLVQDYDYYGIRLHNTNVVTYFRDGSIVLDSGRWQTATTKARMNQYLPADWSVWQEKGVWYLADYRSGWENAKQYIFTDGIKIGPRGGCSGKRRKNKAT